VNGRVMQDGNTRDMVRDVPALIEFLSQSTTLLPEPPSSPARRTAWAWRRTAAVA